MAAFRSRVDSIRRLREQEERLAQVTTALCQSRHTAARADVRDRMQQMESLQNTSCLLMQNIVDGAQLLNLHGAMRQSEVALDAARQKQQESMQALDKAISNYGTARQESQIIQRYIDRERAAFRRTQFRDEGVEADERSARSFSIQADEERNRQQ